jgi:hypothetical protein
VMAMMVLLLAWESGKPRFLYVAIALMRCDE